MKKHIYLLGILFATLCLYVSGCKKDSSAIAANSLSKAVENMSLPKTLNDGSTLTECFYQDNTLTFVCNVDRKKFKKIDEEKSKSNTLKELKSNILSQKLINTVKEANANVQYVYVHGNDTVTYEITSEELQSE